MPDDDDAHVFEVISSQLGQNIGGDLILTERLLVALQPQLSQPCQDLHGVFQQADQIGQVEVIRTTTRAPTIRPRPNRERLSQAVSALGVRFTGAKRVAGSWV